MDGAIPGRTAVEDLLYQCFQARLLEAGIGRVSDTPLPVDVRSVVVARAMRHSRDGTGDLCAPGHLGPGPLLAFGATPLEILRQLTRKGTAPAAGRTGGGTWTDLPGGLIGWDGPLGTMTQVLTGAALAFSQRHEGRAALVFERFAATETGSWHEGLNFAGARRAPLIVVVDVTQGDMREDDPARIAAIARSYGVAFDSVAQEPFMQIFRTVTAARNRALAGDGPTLIALLPRGEGESWTAHDAFVAWALAEGRCSEKQLELIERAASAGVEHAFRRITREPGPEPRDALVPVYAGALPERHWTRRDPPEPAARG